MKKLPALFLAVWMALSLCSCTTAAERKAAEDREQQQLEAVKANTLSSMTPIMEKYGLTDYDITVNSSGSIQEIQCEAFEDLSKEDKFALLCSLLWSGSRYFDLNSSKVITSAGIYTLGTGFEGKATTSVLRKDGNSLYSMLTGDANKRYTSYNSSNSSGASSSSSSMVTCPSCGKKVSRLITKKDVAGVTHSWCSGCWSDYNSIMG